MKLLVLAFYAQFRVGAGRMGVRASRNGMRGASRTSLRHLFVEAECLRCLHYEELCLRIRAEQRLHLRSDD